MPADAVPRIQFTGVNLLRAVAVVAVVYSHISYYLVDDLQTSWWLIDGVVFSLVKYGGLNQHLSFVGVAFFMILTGLVSTASAMRHSPRTYLVARGARLIPVFWVAVALAIVLVQFGVNGMFSRQDGIGAGNAIGSFFLVGFFERPEVVVLGVTWTLSVQILFYLYCVATRKLLLTRPIVAPLIGALACVAILIYTANVPIEYTVPMLDKIAATLPTVFLGQILYLGWARLVSWRWAVLAGLAQFEVIRYATDIDAFHVGQRAHLWTVLLIAGTVLLLARHDSPLTRSRVVHWMATRSYTIYLVHTLVLYRIYALIAPHAGSTVAVAVFLVITGLIADALYRWIEVPAARWITARWAGRRPAVTAVS
ncbi:acyltransferase family protein [Actinomycetes bacterium M1A6_2h]